MLYERVIRIKCCQDKIVVFWIVAICCTCFQKNVCQKKDTPGKCIKLGFGV